MKPMFIFLAALGALYSSHAQAQAYCREFSQGVVIGGQRQSSYGYACMQPDGSWQIISSEQGGGGGYMPPPPPVQPVYMPPPVAYYPPPPPPIQHTGFSISFGSGRVPYYRGDGDCNDRWRWKKKHKHHHYYDRGWGYGSGHGRWRNHDWDD